MPVDLLATLRARTWEAHDALERAAPMKRLLDADVAVDDCRSAMLRLLDFHRWVAARLAACAADPETAARVPAALLGDDRVRDLLADLAALPGGAAASARGGSPEPGPAPDDPRDLVAGLPGALGLLYVSEGSRLGGAVLGRHLAATLGLDRDRGLRFFLGSTPDEAARRWRETCALLAAHGARGSPFVDLVGDAADRCFRAAHRFLAGDRA